MGGAFASDIRPGHILGHLAKGSFRKGKGTKVRLHGQSLPRSLKPSYQRVARKQRGPVTIVEEGHYCPECPKNSEQKGVASIVVVRLVQLEELDTKGGYSTVRDPRE